MAGALLHDIKRKMKQHAIEGAVYARKVLRAYTYTPDEIEDICHAIRNHEAFQPTENINTLEGKLVSDCLYDADKFRWGPDNFLDTVWEMVSYYNPPLSDFLERYPRGMEEIRKIRLHSLIIREQKHEHFIDIPFDSCAFHVERSGVKSISE